MLVALYFMFFLFTSSISHAQNGFRWDSWEGFAVGENDTKNYLELIEEGLCHRVVAGNVVYYTINGATASQLTNTVWSVVGGTVVFLPNSLKCAVVWDRRATTGSIGVRTTQVANNQTVTIPDLCVDILPIPAASFDIAPINMNGNPPNTYKTCRLQELFFENLSFPRGGTPITSYYWDFGDNTSSSLQNPSHAYENNGDYSVTLKVTNTCNGTDSYDATVVVSEKGVPIECASIVCEGQKATYSLPDTFASSCASYNWTVQGGTILSTQPYTKKIEVHWAENPPTDGFGYVTLNPASCSNSLQCYAPTTLKIPIIKQSAPIIGQSTICGSSQVRYKLPQWASTDYRWEIENSPATSASIILTDQRTEIIIAPGTGSGDVILKCFYTNTLLNCGGVGTPLTINIKQLSEINGDSFICADTNSTFTNLSGFSLNWQLKKLSTGAIFSEVEATTFSYFFEQAGEYSLTATSPEICNPRPKLITVTQNATPLLGDYQGPNTVCQGSTITYSFNNTVRNTQIRWSVTGGQIMGSNVGDSVQIIFGGGALTSPPYSITLVRETIGGSSCASPPLIMFPTADVPILDFRGITLLSPPNQTPCGSSTAIYQVATQDMDRYDWTLDPPNAGNITFDPATPWKISVLWNQFSSLPVQIKLKTGKCQKEYFKSVNATVSAPAITIVPLVDSNICRGAEKIFELSPNLLTYTGNIVWDFGNGIIKTSTTRSIAHTFTTISTAPVNYRVTATVTNPNGCTSVVTTPAITGQIKVAPVAIITPAASYQTNNILSVPLAARSLTVTLTSGYGATSFIHWYKDGIQLTTSALSTTYTVTSLGTYYAIVTNATGCSTKTNLVEYKPLGNNPPQPCPNSFSPTIALSYSCGVITATANNTGGPASFAWTSGFSPPASGATAISAVFETKVAGQHTIFYQATYNNNGVDCQVLRFATILIPYIPDLKHEVICSTGNNYLVKLFDNSNYYPITPITNYVYKVSNLAAPNALPIILTSSQITNGISLLPGSYKARLEIARTASPAYPMCSKEILFTLDPKPNIAFTMSSNSVCPGERINLTLNQSINPNWTYLWDFGGTPNTKPDAYVTFGTGTNNIRIIRLTVTNQLGCSFITPIQIVTVKNPLIYTGTQSDIKQCAGTQAVLQFPIAFGTTPPASYQWMRGNVALPNSNMNPYSTTIPGNYWLQTANINGCFKETVGFSVSVAFIDIPTPVINSIPEVCLSSGVPLNSTGVYNPLYQYIWRRNGVELNNLSGGIRDFPQGIGTYSYTLEIKAPLVNTTFCSKTSSPYIVTVIQEPAILSLTYLNEINPETSTCNPYIVKLSATASTNGTFAWSNGSRGATIDVTVGGAYSVLFTSASGCTANATIDVPKDLSTYMWVVPKGCYTFCEDQKPTQQLLGPAVKEFPAWAWLQNSVPIQFDSEEAVTTLDLKPTLYPANYQLQLDNHECLFESEPLQVTYKPCFNAGESCGWFDVDVVNVTLITTPFVHYTFQVSINNSLSTSEQITLFSTNANGYFIPSNITIVPGMNTYTITFIPNPTYTNTVQIRFVASNQNIPSCLVFKDVVFPPVPSTVNKIGAAGTSAVDLIVYPNPATTMLNISYKYQQASNTNALYLYDTTGRLIASYNPDTVGGVWILPIDQLATGLYIVVLKEDGTVIAQQNWIKK